MWFVIVGRNEGSIASSRQSKGQGGSVSKAVSTPQLSLSGRPKQGDSWIEGQLYLVPLRSSFGSSEDTPLHFIHNFFH